MVGEKSVEAIFKVFGFRHAYFGAFSDECTIDKKFYVNFLYLSWWAYLSCWSRAVAQSIPWLIRPCVHVLFGVLDIIIIIIIIIIGFISGNKAHKNSRTIKHKKTDGQTDTKEQQCQALTLVVQLTQVSNYCHTKIVTRVPQTHKRHYSICKNSIETGLQQKKIRRRNLSQNLTGLPTHAKTLLIQHLLNVQHISSTEYLWKSLQRCLFVENC